MKIDYLDLSILKEFCKLKINEETTTWEIMKKIFQSNNGSDVTKKHMLIKRRIEKMSKNGLFFVDGKPKRYFMIKDNVIYKKFNFLNRRSNGIALYINDKWIILEE